MGDFWRRTTKLQWAGLASLIVVILGIVGAFIWHYPFWPISLLIAILAIARIVITVGRNSDARNAQENDPNRR